MNSLTFLDARRGLDARLRACWEELFQLSKFLLDNQREVNLKVGKILNYVSIEDATSAFKDPRYEKYFEAFLKGNPNSASYIKIYEEEEGFLDWEVHICEEALEWLIFISETAALIRLDGLYLTPTVIHRKKKKYFYLKWLGIIYGENIRFEEYEVRKLSGEFTDKTPRRWKFDKKTISLGYIPIEVDEKTAKRINNGRDLELYLKQVKNEKVKKAQLVREVFYLFKTRWKEIQILERLYPIVRSKNKKLPYHKWLNSWDLSDLGMNIVALRRLLYPQLEKEEGAKWFEFWQVFC